MSSPALSYSFSLINRSFESLTWAISPILIIICSNSWHFRDRSSIYVPVLTSMINFVNSRLDNLSNDAEPFSMPIFFIRSGRPFNILDFTFISIECSPFSFTRIVTLSRFSGSLFANSIKPFIVLPSFCSLGVRSPRLFNNSVTLIALSLIDMPSISTLLSFTFMLSTTLKRSSLNPSTFVRYLSTLF